MLRFFVLGVLICLTGELWAQNLKFSSDLLENPRAHAQEFEKSFNIIETGEYSAKAEPGKAVLENGYVQYKFKNPNDWVKGRNIAVTEINIVFTKYPLHKELWQTNYYELLANRLKELFALDPALNSPNFEWNLVLQTNCQSEEQAKKMFHGISIRYINLSDMAKSDRDLPVQKQYDHQTLEVLSQKVNRFIESQGGFSDSVVFNVLDRNRDWSNALVIMDWTGSMYHYGAQAVMWHILNFANSGLTYFTFFNDGDGMADNLKVIGSTGGLYHIEASNIENLINTFYRVTAAGDGGDSEENDLEAVIMGMNKFKDFEELILIADNVSCVRDISLLSEIDVPVHIILCGAEYGINPQYVNIAYKTGGSLHTIESDIKNIASNIKEGRIHIRDIEYQLNNADVLVSRDPVLSGRFARCHRFETMRPPVTHHNVMPQIRRFINDHGGIKDSTPIKVLNRHPLWQDLAVVIQFTHGTYGDAAQVMLWQIDNIKRSGIKYYTLCNDGDQKREREKKVGRTGGIYLTKANNLRRVLNRYGYVEKRTSSNPARAINAVEALMRTRAQYRKAQGIALIASNLTCVRDISIADLLGTPVKVILTDVTGPVNPQYINLAWKTGGSLHFLEEDYYAHLFNAAKLTGSSMLISGHEYILNKNNEWEFKDKASEREFNNCRKYM